MPKKLITFNGFSLELTPELAQSLVQEIITTFPDIQLPPTAAKKLRPGVWFDVNPNDISMHSFENDDATGKEREL